MISTSSAAGMVAGASPAPAQEPTQPHRVLRAFWLGGQRCEVGDVVNLGRVLGCELRNAGKAERHAPQDEQQGQQPPARAPRGRIKRDEA